VRGGEKIPKIEKRMGENKKNGHNEPGHTQRAKKRRTLNERSTVVMGSRLFPAGRHATTRERSEGSNSRGGKNRRSQAQEVEGW